MIELRVLGTFAVQETGDGSSRALALAPRQAALLSYLALAHPRGPVTRDQLLGVFWPELEEPRARAALSQALYRLRVELGRDVVESGGDVVVALRRDQVGCDATALEEALDRGSIEEALEAYGGDLLAGFHLGGTPQFEHWLDAERTRLRTRVVEAATGLATRLEAHGNPAGAAHWLRRVMSWSPYDEPPVLALVRLLGEVGDRSGAIRVYGTFAKRLESDLEIEPSAELQHYIERLRTSPAVTHGSAGPRVEVEETPSPGAVDNPPQNAAADMSTRAAQAVTDNASTLRSIDQEDRNAVTAPAGGPGMRPEFRTRRLAGAGGIGLMLAAVVIGGRILGHDVRPRELLPEGVAILPFSVSGSQRFDFLQEGMVDLLSTSMSVPGRVQPVDPIAVLGTVRPVEGRRIDIERGRQTARRFGVTRFVLGTIIDDGTHARLSATLYDASGSPLVTSNAEIGEDSTLLTGVDRLAAGLLAGYETGQTALSFREAARTTESLPALKAYLLGERLYRQGRFAESAAAFENASSIDTSFALAYYRHAAALGWTGGDNRSSAARAWQLRNHLPARVRLLVEAENAPDDLTRERILRGAVQAYPLDVETHVLLADFYFHRPGSGAAPADVRKLFERVIELQPDHTEALLHLARLAALERDRPSLDSITRMALRTDSIGEVGVELRALRAVVLDDPPTLDRTLDEVRGLDDALFEFLVYRLAAYTGEFDRIRPIAMVMVEPTRPATTRALGLVTLAFLDAAQGKLRAARESLHAPDIIDGPIMLAARGLLAAQPLLPVDTTELDELMEPLAQWHRRRVESPPNGYGDLGQLAYHSNAPWMFEAAVRARRGDTAYARVLADSFDIRWRGGYPADGNEIRALAAWVRGQPRTVLELLDRERGVNAAELYGIGVFLRAEALAELGEDREALRWFGSLMQENHLNFMSQAPVHYAMAEIHERLGDLDQARYHYARFAEMWADCDPELRPLVDRALERIGEIS